VATSDDPRYDAVISALRTIGPGLSETDLTRRASTIVFDEMLHSFDPTVGRRGTKPALKSLNDIHKKAIALFKAIDGIGADEKLALRKIRAPPNELLKAVADVNQHIIAAYNKLTDAPIVPTRAKNRPKKITAERVARNSARIFQQITGKKPTWNNNWPVTLSPFGKFLRDIFGSLDVQASFAEWAKRVCRTQTQK
jgi:hypothetical protein